MQAMHGGHAMISGTPEVEKCIYERAKQVLETVSAKASSGNAILREMERKGIPITELDLASFLCSLHDDKHVTWVTNQAKRSKRKLALCLPPLERQYRITRKGRAYLNELEQKIAALRVRPRKRRS